MSERIFLDWKRPLLPAVRDWLVEHRSSDGLLDLSRCEILCVSRRSGRRLLELLIDAADAADLAFDPPEILTLRAWSERHRADSAPPASELEKQLAWRQALQGLSGEQRELLAMPSGVSEAWTGRLMQLRSDLGWGNADFAAAFQAARERSFGEEQIERWRTLRDLEAEYLRVLERAGRSDPPIGGAVGELPPGVEVLSAGLVEMPAGVREALRGCPDRIHLVHAPEAMAEHFDAFGIPIEESWRSRPLSLRQDQILVAEDSAQAALLAVDRLAELSAQGDGMHAADLTVTVVDAEAERPLVDALKECGIPSHDARGIETSRQPLPRLLRALAALLRDDDVAAFRDLLRLSEVEHALRSAAGDAAVPLKVFDDFQKKALQHSMSLREEIKRGPRLPYRDALRLMLGELTGDARTLSQWQRPLLDCLRRLLEQEDFDPSHPGGRHQIQMLDALSGFLRSWSSLPAAVDPRVDAATALSFLADHVEAQSLALVPEAGSIETVGWLELAQDEAPHAFVLGLNEGMLPTLDPIDPLLNQGMRAALGLRHDGSRLARDSYWLESILQSRQSCTLFVALRSLGNDPLRPSRLLFRCEDEAIPERVGHVFHALELLRPSDEAGPDGDAAAILRPPDLQPWLDEFETISVSAFRDYLACPYRHALRHRLKLRDDPAAALDELDAAAFGILLHDVLEEFGRSESADSSDPGEIEAFLLAELDALAARRFGPHVVATVPIQLESARERLRGFSEWQARRRADGWRIRHVEMIFDESGSFLEVDGTPVGVRGRIDRVDVHDDGSIAILDYKTANQAGNPMRTHGPVRGTGAWKDLQLPLYEHLYRQAEEVGAGISIELAYCNLGREGAELLPANWDAEQRAAAMDCARDVVRAIRSGELPPPDPKAAKNFPELAPICRDDALLADEEAAE